MQVIVGASLHCVSQCTPACLVLSCYHKELFAPLQRFSLCLFILGSQHKGPSSNNSSYTGHLVSGLNKYNVV